MAPSKTSKKQKQQKRGVDFKKIKRKIGRKLPPPKNATNTEIKSKAIILPEQSVAADKGGLAVNKRGLTLKELLQQSSHRNAKVRKDALMGIRDLLLTNPAELTQHKYAIIEKLRERVGDDDKVVRETLYQLFKSVIFPGCKEEHQGMFISLLMTYIFHAMTNFAIEVRLMAFKFLELVLQHYPDSIFLYAEKIFQNYEDMLRMNKFYLQEKGKLKIVLSGLLLCLSRLPFNKREDDSAEKKVAEGRVLHPLKPDLSTENDGCCAIIPKLKDLLPILVNYFEDFWSVGKSAPLYDAQSFDCMLCLLQSINLSVRLYPNFTDHEDNFRPQPYYKRCYANAHANVQAETIATVVLKNLLLMFPLTPIHQVSEKGEEMYFTINSTIIKIFLHLRLTKWIFSSGFLEKILKFVESALLGKICSGTRSAKSVREKNLLPLLPFIPDLISQLESDWKSCLLEAFTKTFMDCDLDSSLKLACLETIEQMITPNEAMVYRVPDILDYQIVWVRELPELLMTGEKHQSFHQAVLHLVRHFAVSCVKDPSLKQEFEYMQYSLREFFSTRLDDGNIRPGPFVRLSRDSQTVALSCLRFFHSLDPPFLMSITQCCLCPDLKPEALFDIMSVLHLCASKPPVNLWLGYYFNFFMMLLSKFRVFPGNIFPFMDNDPNSNRGTFMEVRDEVYTDLRAMRNSDIILRQVEDSILKGMSAEDIFPFMENDPNSNCSTSKLVPEKVLTDIRAMAKSDLLLRLVEDALLKGTSSGLPLDNVCAMLWLLDKLNREPIDHTKHKKFGPPRELRPHIIASLQNVLPGYMIDIAHRIPKHDTQIPMCVPMWEYFIFPCFGLFEASHNILHHVLETFASLITGSSSSLPSHDQNQYVVDRLNTVEAIVSVLHVVAKYFIFRKILSSFKEDVELILQKIVCLQSSEEINLTPDAEYKLQSAVDQVTKILSSLN